MTDQELWWRTVLIAGEEAIENDHQMARWKECRGLRPRIWRLPKPQSPCLKKEEWVVQIDQSADLLTKEAHFDEQIVMMKIENQEEREKAEEESTPNENSFLLCLRWQRQVTHPLLVSLWTFFFKK